MCIRDRTATIHKNAPSGGLRTDSDPLTKRYAVLGTPRGVTWVSGTVGDERVPGPSTYWIDAVVVLAVAVEQHHPPRAPGAPRPGPHGPDQALQDRIERVAREADHRQRRPCGGGGGSHDHLRRPWRQVSSGMIWMYLTTRPLSSVRSSDWLSTPSRRDTSTCTMRRSKLFSSRLIVIVLPDSSAFSAAR